MYCLQLKMESAFYFLPEYSQSVLMTNNQKGNYIVSFFETKTIDIIQQYITDQFDSTVKVPGDLGVLQKQIPTYNDPPQLGGQRLWCFSR